MTTFLDLSIRISRPFWSWLHLLPPGITTPDTVMVAPSASGDDFSSRAAVPSVRPGSSNQHEGRHTITGRLDESRRFNESHAFRSLVWVSSRPESVSSNGSSMGEGVSRDDVMRGCATSEASSEDGQRISSDFLEGMRHDFVELVGERPGYPSPRGQQQLYAQIIHQEEELIRAARAICECGRRGGGGVGVVEPKLPIALLKLWERSFNAGTRPHFPDSEQGKASGGRRKLTVVRKRGGLNSSKCAGNGECRGRPYRRPNGLAVPLRQKYHDRLEHPRRFCSRFEGRTETRDTRGYKCARPVLIDGGGDMYEKRHRPFRVVTENLLDSAFLPRIPVQRMTCAVARTINRYRFGQRMMSSKP